MPSSMSSSQEQRTRSTVSSPSISQSHCRLSTDINSELDELDREEFYRLKKVSNKKQRDQAAADAEMLKAREKEKNGRGDENGDDPVDVLGEHEDDDVIF